MFCERLSRSCQQEVRCWRFPEVWLCARLNSDCPCHQVLIDFGSQAWKGPQRTHSYRLCQSLPYAGQLSRGTASSTRVGYRRGFPSTTCLILHAIATKSTILRSLVRQRRNRSSKLVAPTVAAITNASDWWSRPIYLIFAKLSTLWTVCRRNQWRLRGDKCQLQLPESRGLMFSYFPLCRSFCSRTRQPLTQNSRATHRSMELNLSLYRSAFLTSQQPRAEIIFVLGKVSSNRLECITYQSRGTFVPSWVSNSFELLVWRITRCYRLFSTILRICSHS